MNPSDKIAVSAIAKNEPDFLNMSSSELLVFMGDKCDRWARAFCAIAKAQGFSVPYESFIIPWFCNAIEAGRPEKKEPTTGDLSALRARIEEAHFAEQDSARAKLLADCYSFLNRFSILKKDLERMEELFSQIKTLI
jgi:hypothetical protein